MSQKRGKAVSIEAEPVEIWLKLIKSADGYPESQDWEELWARPVDALDLFVEGYLYCLNGSSKQIDKLAIIKIRESVDKWYLDHPNRSDRMIADLVLSFSGNKR